MKNFLKGIIVGIGGISPGLSGSVLLVILGLYQKTIEAVGTIFKNFKKNVLFLTPLFLGFGVGIVLFGKIINYLLENYEMYVRYAFLGLVIGTIPLFYKEVKNNGFSKKYYIYILISFIIGIFLSIFNKELFSNIINPNIFQSIILGIILAGSSIIPGIDSAVILSTLGLYELYVSSIANLNFYVLIPALIGLIFGALIISNLMKILLEKYYTVTFSIIFGLFISIIPNVLNEKCIIGFNIESIISFIIAILGFALSYYLGNKKIKKN